MIEFSRVNSISRLTTHVEFLLAQRFESREIETVAAEGKVKRKLKAIKARKMLKE